VLSKNTDQSKAGKTRLKKWRTKSHISQNQYKLQTSLSERKNKKARPAALTLKDKYLKLRLVS
jgi:hypothetical protein